MRFQSFSLGVSFGVIQSCFYNGVELVEYGFLVYSRIILFEGICQILKVWVVNYIQRVKIGRGKGGCQRREGEGEGCVFEYIGDGI